jgi:hypothetical protein
LLRFLNPFVNMELANNSAARSDLKLPRGKPIPLTKVAIEPIGTNEGMIVGLVLSELLQCQLTKRSTVDRSAWCNNVDDGGSREPSFFFVRESSVMTFMRVLEPGLRD